MARLILLNKPHLVQCKFTDDAGRPTLADYLPIKDVYAAGRLDHDTEGLIVLTDAGWLQSQIAEPRYKLPKAYLAQVEGTPTEEALQTLRRGVKLGDGLTLPAHAEEVPEPDWLWERTPPIRFRKAIPTAWILLTIIEGRNRQVRRMTAAVGLPTLRLIRVAIGDWNLGNLQPGQWEEIEAPLPPQWERTSTPRYEDRRPYGRRFGGGTR